MKKPIYNRLVFIFLLIIVVCIAHGGYIIETFDVKNNPFVNDIDVVYYINLDHRNDRNKEILQEFENVGIPSTKIVRVSGNYNKQYGDVGCSKSHIDALRKFSESPYKNCIIFEDDFTFTQTSNDVLSMLHKLFENNVNYDVCMLSANTAQHENSGYPFLKKVIESQTASGYMVNKSFARTLLANFEEGVQHLEKIATKEDDKRGMYCVDQYWKSLQPDTLWYEFHPKLGIQRESYSDIQGGIVSYNT